MTDARTDPCSRGMEMDDETLFRSVVKLIEITVVLVTSVLIAVNLGWIPMFTFLGSLYVLLTWRDGHGKTN